MEMMKIAEEQEEPQEQTAIDVDADSDTVDADSRIQQQKQRKLSSSIISLALQDDQWAFAPPISPNSGSPLVAPGSYRYLKGADLDGMTYDFAIVTHRKLMREESFSMDGSFSKEDMDKTLLEKLVANGLDVDIIEGDFSTMLQRSAGADATNSKYYVLLIRGNDDALATYGSRLKFQTWLRTGNTRDVNSVVNSSPIVTPADRIQVIDHIIREGARITTADPQIHSIFPVHDPKTNQYLLRTFIQTQKLEFLSENFLGKMKAHFGEKVAYYFAFMDCYNKALVPIAVLGVLLTCFRGLMGTVIYMRVLVAWAILISVGWSYWFLKSWTRRNNELNYQWDNNVDSPAILYRNPNFRGKTFINPVTGLRDQSYPSWKRYPMYFVELLFMVLQISIMMLIIACWITVFEVLKVRYPDKGLFSAQWFYILGGGICYGLFVDIFQWNIIVTKAARMFTEWENWKTIEQFEKSLVRKLFVMDFLNYYTWFFLLAFVYVIPGVGDTITNFLNTVIWKDPANCCFGPYLDRDGSECRMCPPSWHSGDSFSENRCVPCRGWVTFDINHLDLETLFLTPIIVTQGLNLLIAVLVPYIHRQHHEQKLKASDKKAMAMVKAQGSRQILGGMTYRDERAQLTNKSKARYFENDDAQVEKLNAKAREILFESEQEDYDPYGDYHHVTVQFGFVVMFSMLWPPMPMACIVVNALKMRGDGFRLCHTLKRPFPRKASSIGEWHMVLHLLAVIGVIVNIGLIFISTGAMEFYSSSCTSRIRNAVGNNFSHFRFGPDFSCFSLSTRMVLILVSEHIVFACIWVFWKYWRSVPASVELAMIKREYKFKKKLYEQSTTSKQVNLAAGSAAGATAQEEKKKTPNKKRRSAQLNVNISHNMNAQQSGAANNGRYTEMTVASPMSSSSASLLNNLVMRRSKNHGTRDEKTPLLSSKLLVAAWDAVVNEKENAKQALMSASASSPSSTSTTNSSAFVE